jgi:hypothetical protein
LRVAPLWISERRELPATITRSVTLVGIAPIAIASAVIGAIIAITRPVTVGPMVTNCTSHARAYKAVVAENMAGNTADNCAFQAASGACRARC